jgi:hypothetical protein
MLYVSVTRAMHAVTITHTGGTRPFLRNPPNERNVRSEVPLRCLSRTL